MIDTAGQRETRETSGDDPVPLQARNLRHCIPDRHCTATSDAWLPGALRGAYLTAAAADWRRRPGRNTGNLQRNRLRHITGLPRLEIVVRSLRTHRILVQQNAEMEGGRHRGGDSGGRCTEHSEGGLHRGASGRGPRLRHAAHRHMAMGNDAVSAPSMGSVVHERGIVVVELAPPSTVTEKRLSVLSHTLYYIHNNSSCGHK